MYIVHPRGRDLKLHIPYTSFSASLSRHPLVHPDARCQVKSIHIDKKYIVQIADALVAHFKYRED